MTEFLQSLHNRLTVDILDRSLTAVGAGPLTSCTGAAYARVLSGAGTFRATFPATEPRIADLAIKANLLDFYYDGVLEFRGIVEGIERTYDQSGIGTVTVSGRDLLAELAEAPVGFLDLSNAGAGVTNGPALILAAATTFTGHAWAIDTAAGYTTTATAVYAKFSGESALSALVRVGEHIGEHWRLKTDGTRKIVWLRATTPASNVRAIGDVGDGVEAHFNPQICLIQHLSVNQDGSAIYNRIYPYGGGTGDVRQTIKATTKTPAAGFTLSTANNYIENDTEVAAVPIGRYVEFKQIRPISNTDTDLVSAADAVFDAGYALLKTTDEATDTITYRLAVVKLPVELDCGETIELLWDRDEYQLDANLIVHAIETTVNADGAKYHVLTVSPVARRVALDADLMVQEMEQGQIFSAHPQTNANSYTTGYTKPMFNDGVLPAQNAVIRFRLGDEVVQVQQVVFEFETDDGTMMLPLESTVIAVGGETSGSGVVDIGGPSVDTSGNPSNDTSGTPSTADSGTPSNNTSGSPSTDETGDPTGGDVISAGQHKHYHNVIRTADPGGAGYEELWVNPAGGQMYIADTGDSFHIDTENSGNHTHDLSSHTHSMSSHTHSLSSHTHSLSNHTHSLSNHTHDLSESIVPLYGVFRDADANTFLWTDLTYSINGAAAVDLNHATLGAVQIGATNWYALDITAAIRSATTFRPLAASNTITFARKGSVGGGFASRKSCTIDGLLSVRCSIQAILYIP